ncbi:DNA polymerase III subunit chi [Acinetobacter stercoris]|uniref:DNA polymerase III subunit chi n=1 Tax=Acinetobacter stercoris TaxID=2126983 RepID=A0A2U3MZJ1_9GAMM|nr:MULTISPECIES: DNA polymerase III subunit chi [Acinetobacter]SPL70803.1 DNA polymerase III subunit chi [Acinetobacter stercoris]
MAKISFYLFEKSPERQVDSACRLCRKLLLQNKKIWLYSPDENLQKELDDLLWTFDKSSFYAHGINQVQAPICIAGHLPTDAERIVFNFNNQALEQINFFSHIIEIIENEEAAKIIGREKFKSYRRLGVEPRTFKL